MAMAQSSVLHRGFAPYEVDAMDLVTIWALLGIGKQERDMRDATRAYEAPVPTLSMVPLTDEEKAARYEARQTRRVARRGPTTGG